MSVIIEFQPDPKAFAKAYAEFLKRQMEDEK
jgi:hypothetical protein